MHFQRGSIVFFALPTWVGMPKHVFSARIYSVFCIVNLDGNAHITIAWTFKNYSNAINHPNATYIVKSVIVEAQKSPKRCVYSEIGDYGGIKITQMLRI